MKVSLNELGHESVTRVVIESVDLSLYIAHVTVGDVEHVLTDRHGKVLKTRNLLEMQRTLRKRACAVCAASRAGFLFLAPYRDDR